jgi:hypothetical protein
MKQGDGADLPVNVGHGGVKGRYNLPIERERHGRSKLEFEI